MSWPVRKIGELADLCLGKMLDQKKNKGTLRPYLANVNVRWGEIKLDDLREMRFEDRELERYGLRNGDIVMCEGGEPGRCAIWRGQLSSMMFQKALHRIRVKEGIDHRFLYYCFIEHGRTGIFEQYFTGSTIKHLPGEKLAKVEVAVAPLAVQRRIASILSAYDDLIENNTRRIAILEEMARRIYEEWFVRFRFPGHENVRMVESELGLVPEGWSIDTVENVFDTLGGGTPSKAEPDFWSDGVLNWYAPTDLTGARTVFMEESSAKINALGLAKSSAKLFPANSVMMTSRATIGVIAVNTTEACTNQGFITCLPSARFPLWLLFHWLKANVGIFESLGTGATFKEITKGVFRKIELLVPEAGVVQAFENVVRPMMSLVLSLERKNRNLRTTRDLLLPKLISGELDVSALPEPEVCAA